MSPTPSLYGTAVTAHGVREQYLFQSARTFASLCRVKSEEGRLVHGRLDDSFDALHVNEANQTGSRVR